MNNKFPRVTVLLSTYNGDKYIGEQLDSLLNQTYNNFNILVRDDGSSDNTVNILELYEKRYPSKFSIIKGINVGVIKSFFELIECCSEDSSYIAFCDQDDFWEPLKIERAVSALEASKAKIKGYCSNLKLVDEKLNFIKYRYNSSLKVNFNNSIFENVVTGCTLVVNNSLILILKKKLYEIDLKKIIMHDWLIYIIITSLGEMIYDEHSYIKYRQHSNNVVGVEMNKLSFMKKKILNFNKNRNQRKIQSMEFFKNFQEFMNEYDRKNIKNLIFSSNIKERIKFIKNNSIVRQNIRDKIVTIILIILDKY